MGEEREDAVGSQESRLDGKKKRETVHLYISFHPIYILN